MKKVILTGFSLMAFAAASFAQNTASYSGVGTSQTSTQKQTGNLLTSTVIQGTTADGVSANNGNIVYTEQKAVSNTTKVTQTTSNYNQAQVFQNTGSSTATPGSNEVAIEQIGSGQGAQRGFNFGGPLTTSSGTFGNEARIGQENAGNQAYIQQNGGGSSNFSNVARIDQTGSNNGDASGFSGTIFSYPPSDAVGIYQNNLSQGNAAGITQSGNGNKQTAINQSDNSIQNLATISQTGDLNTKALINQSGNSQQNVATISQNGGSSADIEQTGSGQNSNNNTASITQNTNGNMGLVKQQDNSHDNSAAITQSGLGNATINQVTNVANSEATVTQGGATLNTATVTQTNAYKASGTDIGFANGGNTVTVNQNVGQATGGGNAAVVTQGDAAAAATYAARATVNQTGSESGAYLQQTGHDLQADVTQSGFGNVLTSGTTFGSTSLANQLGSSYQLTVTQAGGATTGNSNLATVNSNNVGGGGVTILQTLLP